MLQYTINSGPSIMPACSSRIYRHYNGNRDHSANCHHWLFPSVRRNFTGTIAGNPHYRRIFTPWQRQNAYLDAASKPLSCVVRLVLIQRTTMPNCAARCPVKPHFSTSSVRGRSTSTIWIRGSVGSWWQLVRYRALTKLYIC